MRTHGLLLLLSIAFAAPAQNRLTEAEKAAGWKLLFDGTTFNGWEETSKGDSWMIEDGCLKSRAKPKLREDVFTKASFGDFELTFEWRISPGGNSGLKYQIQDRFFVDERRLAQFAKFEELANDSMRTRATKREAATQEYVVGFEYQVIDDSGHADARRGAHYQAGALYAMLPAIKAAAKPVGEFNQARVVVRGGHIEHWLNGVKVVDGDLSSPLALEKTAARWTTASPVYRALAARAKRRSPIALQNHGDEAWFRGLKIRDLR